MVTGHPGLYTLRATLSVPGHGTHTATADRFPRGGVPPGRLLPERQRLTIFGLNRHQLFPYAGLAHARALQRRDAEILKHELNCNMVRCSHYPQSPHFLDACDELGLMVWAEPPGWQYVGDAAWQDLVVANVRDMVIRDRNRPSVIIWGTRLNETVHPGLYQQTRQLATTWTAHGRLSGAVDGYSTSDWARTCSPSTTTTPATATRAAPAAAGPAVPRHRGGRGAGRRGRHFRWTDPDAILARQAVYARAGARHRPVRSGLRRPARLGGFDYASQKGRPSGPERQMAGVTDTFRVAKPGAAFYLSQSTPGAARSSYRCSSGTSGRPPPGPGPGRDDRHATATGWKSSSAAPPATSRPCLDAELYGHLAYPPPWSTSPCRHRPPELRIDGYLGGKRVGSVRMSAHRHATGCRGRRR